MRLKNAKIQGPRIRKWELKKEFNSALIHARDLVFEFLIKIFV